MQAGRQAAVTHLHGAIALRDIGENAHNAEYTQLTKLSESFAKTPTKFMPELTTMLSVYLMH